MGPLADHPFTDADRKVASLLFSIERVGVAISTIAVENIDPIYLDIAARLRKPELRALLVAAAAAIIPGHRALLLRTTSLPGLVAARIVTPARSRRGRRIHNGGRGWPDGIRPPAIVFKPRAVGMTDVTASAGAKAAAVAEMTTWLSGPAVAGESEIEGI